jgi:hypothetical protein
MGRELLGQIAQGPHPHRAAIDQGHWVSVPARALESLGDALSNVFEALVQNCQR